MLYYYLDELQIERRYALFVLDRYILHLSYRTAMLTALAESSLLLKQGYFYVY